MDINPPRNRSLGTFLIWILQGASGRTSRGVTALSLCVLSLCTSRKTWKNGGREVLKRDTKSCRTARLVPQLNQSTSSQT